MSKKRIVSRCLVIDASIARAAGTLESPDPTPKRCSDFLVTVRGVCHRMAWSQAIKAEWDHHQSSFAEQWLVTMLRFNKLQTVRDEPLGELREAINEHSSDPNVVSKMLKDAHLFEAALASDLRIASRDVNARGHFARLAAAFHALKGIMWVDPVVEGEHAVDWLEKGAPLQRSRLLKP